MNSVILSVTYLIYVADACRPGTKTDSRRPSRGHCSPVTYQLTVYNFTLLTPHLVSYLPCYFLHERGGISYSMCLFLFIKVIDDLC